jgi:predicted DsbA family dithiol-disulfide isomerase
MSVSESVGNNTEKKLIKIDVSSDTVCPWCFVGKRNLDKAIAASKDQYDFEVLSLCLSLRLCVVCVPPLIFYQLNLQVRWHPFQLNPSAPKEGIEKKEFYRKKFGSQSERIEARMSEVFQKFSESAIYISCIGLH